MSIDYEKYFEKILRDKVTGFEGTVTGFAAYATGCNQYLLQPEVKADGTWVDAHWFDDARLVTLKHEPINDNPPNGPDIPAPIR